MPDANLTCIIIDDQEQAHAVLKLYLDRLDFVELKGTFLNAMDAYNFLRTEKTDLIFLDINMPEVDGFTFLDMLSQRPMIIVTTAYLDHAYKSFEYNAVDYLYKPVRFERFVTAIEKAGKWKQLHAGQKAELYSIEVKADGYKQQVATGDILFTESLGNYIKIHTGGKPIVTFLTTKEIEEMLQGGPFIRIHKSYIVNTDKLTEVRPDEVLIGHTTLPIGKTYKKYIDHLLKGK